MLVRFSPQGAGRRTGRITVADSISAEPFSLGLGGNGYAPVISFIPAVISTVPGTYPSNAGLLSGAQNLTVDGSDTIYIADTGNNTIRYINSSGTIRSLATSADGVSAPTGIAIDSFGETYFSETAAGKLYEIFAYGSAFQLSGTHSDACTVAAPCSIANEAVSSPGQMSADSYGRIFFANNDGAGAGMLTAQPYPASFAHIYNPFIYQTTFAAFSVDSNDNLYTQWATGGVCAIVSQSLYNSEDSNQIYQKVVGGHTCGFAGDGGQAGNAEISNKIGQIVFDLAGNMYFSDTGNQRVRRIDRQTGQINTIAGGSAAGYTGDGSASTSARLSYPTGVGVDSQGQVFIISGTGSSSGGPQVLRKVGPDGAVAFSSTAVGSANGGTVTVSNTGNDEMELLSTVMHGVNPGDFSINAVYTTCNLAPGSYLGSGQSCKINFTFKPTAAGSRSAVFTYLDNSITGYNNIQLYGTATLPTPSMSIASPVSGSSHTAGTAFVFKVTVTSGSTPAPTGTVSLQLDGGTIAGSPVTLASGAAQVNVSSSTTGSHTLKAIYNGDSHYASTSVTETITVVSASNVPVRIIGAPVQRPVKIKLAQNAQK